MPDDVRLITDLWEARLGGLLRPGLSRSGARAAELPRGDGRGGAPAPVRIGLVVPVSGMLGLIGPVAINCALLGAAEINAAGGLLGREVELVLIDAGLSAEQVANDVATLVRDRAIDAVVGTHASDVRRAVAPAVAGAVPYVYTPPYEGGERTPGVFLAGEVPDRQLRPVLSWFVHRRRAARWYLLGNDYIWPRRTHAAAHRYLRALGAEVVGERFVPMGRCQPQPLLDEIARTRPDVVLLTLIGSDLIAFNRGFAASRLGARVARLGAALEENGLLAAGGDGTGELYATMGYFANLSTDAGLAFAERYAKRFGPYAPVLSGHGEGCYDGIRLLAALVERAGSLTTQAVDQHADGTEIVGGRGRLVVSDRHVDQPVYLARAEGLELNVIAAF